MAWGFVFAHIRPATLKDKAHTPRADTPPPPLPPRPYPHTATYRPASQRNNKATAKQRQTDTAAATPGLTTKPDTADKETTKPPGTIT